jgi:hypothetical protein
MARLDHPQSQNIFSMKVIAIKQKKVVALAGGRLPLPPWRLQRVCDDGRGWPSWGHGGDAARAQPASGSRGHVRAVRRLGELLKTFNNERARTDLHDGAVTQKAAAESAGISERQRVTAVRVANVPAEKFEAAVEGEKPATVTALAEMASGRSRQKCRWFPRRCSNTDWSMVIRLITTTLISAVATLDEPARKSWSWCSI